ncbi:hypothetical protein H6G81_27565 [Scytonema hofmannii FACHB-248]|uniref:Uncharacterized protein n=2 Tax=Nostocales TaxID=1161 RepID=A0ABR8GXB2_9CYAN|nr:hypothetical protein [Scytonema hofmannii]MBD2608171.1 hypothetical protein [Scytonema hofmannii FACHB-248]
MWDKTIRLWDVKSCEQRCILTGHLGAVNTIAISPNGQTLISGTTDTTSWCASLWADKGRSDRSCSSISFTGFSR